MKMEKINLNVYEITNDDRKAARKLIKEILKSSITQESIDKFNNHNHTSRIFNFDDIQIRFNRVEKRIYKSGFHGSYFNEFIEIKIQHKHAYLAGASFRISGLGYTENSLSGVINYKSGINDKILDALKIEAYQLEIK